jgi:hypothetical protein
MSDLDQGSSLVTFEKSVALSTVYGGKDLTLRKRKAINTIAYVTREAFFTRNPEFSSVPASSITKKMVEETNTTYEIEQNFLMKSMGFKKEQGRYYSYGQVLKILKQLSDDTIYFDGLGIAKRDPEGEDWSGFTRIIASAERDEGMFRIHVPPDVVHRLVNPDVSFQGLVDLSGIVCKNSPQIIDICMYNRQKGNSVTDWYLVDELRTLLGATAKTWSEWRRLNQKYISAIVGDINGKKDLDFTIEVDTTSRAETSFGRPPITHVRFKIIDKAVKPIGVTAHRLELDLTTQKAELRNLGIADNQIEGVLDECRDESGVLMIEFIQWVNRRGYEIKRLTDYKDRTFNEFGGILRKQVLRKEKDNWLKTNAVLNNYLKSRKGLTADDMAFKDSKSLLNDEIKRAVTNHFLQGLSEGGYVRIREEFETFVEQQMPVMLVEVRKVLGSCSLMEVQGRAFNLLTVYLRERHAIYSHSAYNLAIQGM